jgi:hypothetical protein
MSAAKSDAAREFFYLEDHRKQDSKLHDPILTDGDDAAARKISDKTAKRLGLTADEVAALRRPLRRRTKPDK